MQLTPEASQQVVTDLLFRINTPHDLASLHAILIHTQHAMVSVHEQGLISEEVFWSWLV